MGFGVIGRTADIVKGFGCRPDASDRPVMGAGVRKPDIGARLRDMWS
jgi:hypothetical protein